MKAPCQFEPLENGAFRCATCGFTTRRFPPDVTAASIARSCPFGRELFPEETPEPPPPPGFWRRAANFAAAALKQAPLFVEAALTGDETVALRSPAEIERIAAICKACPLFNGEVCTHKNCGCQISADRSAWLSKLAWRSQKCPDDPPKWGEGVAPPPPPPPPPWPPAREWLIEIPPGAGIPEGAYIAFVRARSPHGYLWLLEFFHPLDGCREYDRLALRLTGGTTPETAEVFLACSVDGRRGPRWSAGPLPRGSLARRLTLRADDGRLGDVIVEAAESSS